jgi:excisionase family DNA binding protein
MNRTAANSQVVVEREWLDLRGLTVYAAVSERTVREWLHRSLNPLPAVRVGTKILVRRATFDAWLERHPLIPAETININETVNEILADMAASAR